MKGAALDLNDVAVDAVEDFESGEDVGADFAVEGHPGQ